MAAGGHNREQHPSALMMIRSRESQRAAAAGAPESKGILQRLEGEGLITMGKSHSTVSSPMDAPCVRRCTQRSSLSSTSTKPERMQQSCVARSCIWTMGESWWMNSRCAAWAMLSRKLSLVPWWGNKTSPHDKLRASETRPLESLL